MRVILTEDIPKLGNAGDVVRVKRGYGRNYLLPKGLAQLATEGRVTELEHQKRIIEEKVKKDVADQQKMGAALAGVAISFEMQTNEEGRLFGSVTNADIQAQLAEKGFELDRRKIALAEPIKQAGEHEVTVRLHREVLVTLPVVVTSSGTVAEPEVEQTAADEQMEAAEAREDEDE